MWKSIKLDKYLEYRLSLETYLEISDIILEDNLDLNLYVVLILGMVHTGDESLWDGLRDMWTCGTTLASAYMLCYLSAT